MTLVTLSEVAEVLSGAGFPTEYQGHSDGDVPFAKVGDISKAKRREGVTISSADHYVSFEVCKKLNAKIFPAETIVFAKIGEAIRNGNKVMVARPMIFDNNVMGLVPRKDKIFPRYLYRYVDSLDFFSLANSTTVPSIRKTDMEALQVWLPPLQEQKRIAGILDQADELRRKRQRALDRLNQLGQAIFIEMFGDPTNNPKGWSVAQLGEIVSAGDRINYGVVQPGDEVESGVPLIRVGDLLKPFIDPSHVKHIDPAIERNYGRSRLIGDEILIGCVGSIGTVALAHAGLKGANIARAVARVPLDHSKVDRRFLTAMIRSPLVQRYFTAETRVVAQPTLNIGLIVAAPILLPPLDLQRAFSQKLDAIEPIWTALGSGIIACDKLFASLQHRAFHGELSSSSLKEATA